jgi:hypothetical protein
MFLKNYLIVAVVIVGMAALAGANPTTPNQSIIVNPIGNHHIGEKFNITGTVTDQKIKKIGIEIFPKKYWDNTTEFAKEDNNGRVKYQEIAATSDNTHPSGINLVKYNSDGTQSYRPFDNCDNHWITVVSVKKDSAGKNTWSADILQNDKGQALIADKYHVNVWDASNEVDRPGVVMPNGWDIRNKTIYPSTTMVNIWDPKNQKELEYSEFEITKK